MSMLQNLHLKRIHAILCYFLINHFLVGTKIAPVIWLKRKLLQSAGNSVGDGTTIVGPIVNFGKLEIGANCWINRDFVVHGNGRVIIADNCDIAPEVTFLTGGHQLSGSKRRAGKGENYVIEIGEGCWIGARSTILRNIRIGKGSVVAACSCVINDVPENVLVGGVPAKVIRSLRSTP